jgi:hypothetical protein
MSPTTKKSAWGIIGIGTGIVTLVTFAYTAGVRTSASAHAVAFVNERVDDTQEDVEDIKASFNKHVETQAVETKKVNGHLHHIDIRLAEQTQILKRIERNE